MKLLGYDGSELAVGTRIELHPGCNLWMQGARYGVITKVGRKRIAVQLDRQPSGALLTFHSTALRSIPS